jgi:predicted esterase
MLNRREFVGAAGSALGALVVGAGTGAPSPGGRLRARPRAGVTSSATGEVALPLGTPREALLRVPPDPGEAPLPLLVAFHGATGSASAAVRGLGAAADAAGLALLATSSRGTTWDAIRGGFGPDVDALDRALEHVFQVLNVDPARITAAGFSDGATYALSLGLINGDLFGRVVAFSPGFIVEGEPAGHPAFFISHGTEDPILPIERCSRQLVPLLRGRGYQVTYREFAGGHTVPPEIAREGFAWAAAVGP